MTEPADIHFLDDDTLMPFPDLADASGLAIEHLVELADFGVFEPVQSAGAAAPTPKTVFLRVWQRPQAWQVATAFSIFVLRLFNLLTIWVLFCATVSNISR